MYLNTILRKLKVDEADYTLTGIFLGCYLGSKETWQKTAG
jgi:hypothetical protein